MAYERFHSTGASQSAWKNGMIVGAGALGLTCAYLTHKAFALSEDPVSESLIFYYQNVYRLESTSMENNQGHLFVQGRNKAIPRQGTPVLYILVV